jgi:ribonuclease R
MYRAYIMRDRVGEHFHGVVSAVTSFGAFVELESPYVEGLLKLEALGDEGFNYDQVHMRLSGKRTGKTIELGDKVEVEILNVSVLRRRIEFGLVAATHGIARTPVADNPRIGLGAKRKAGREVEQAARGGASAATPRRSGDGKLRLKVSHRGSGPSGRDDRGGRPSGGGGGGKPAKGGKGGKAGGKRGGRR